MGFDYSKLGFKCGIELHQELDVGKLFCSCCSSMKEEGQIMEVSRKLRLVAGETGDVDPAVQYEFFRDRTFVYHGYQHEACLVDIDAEPPHKINQDALEIALKVAFILKMQVPSIIRIMRKVVADGSAPSGFQRTSVVGLGVSCSKLETSKGPVGMMSMNLEEDSCKIEKRAGNKVYYSLSRLGIPLIELGTMPDIKDPEHAKEVALRIGRIFRSFPGVKRGIGTIRQDVNVSIGGGSRVEVKGWQDLYKLPLLIENEVERQVMLLNFKKKLIDKKVTFRDKPIECTDIFKDSKSRVISISIGSKGVVYGLVLRGLAGFLKEKISGPKHFGAELADYAKAYGVKGMIHTDEDLSKYGLEQEFGVLCKKVRSKPDDLVLVIAGPKSTVVKAINAVHGRAKILLKGVPEETRVPNHVDATSSYARPLPGGARMYPETDEVDIVIDSKMLSAFQKSVPELLEDKEKRYVSEFGLSEQIARTLVDSGYCLLFEKMVSKYGKKYAKKVANFFVNDLSDLRSREKIDTGKLPDSLFIDVFGCYVAGKIVYGAVFVIIKEYVKCSESVATIIRDKGLKCLSRSDAEKVVCNIVATKKLLSSGAIMGIVMKELKGKVDGVVISELVRKHCKK